MMIKLLLERVDIFDSPEDCFDTIVRGREGSKIISFLNAHAVNLAYSDVEFRKALLESDYLLRDGVGVSIAMKYNHILPGFNMNGTDFIPDFIKRHSGKKFAFIGTDEKYIKIAAEFFSDAGVDVVLYMDGFRSFDEYERCIVECLPEIVILGMGMPKQELFSKYLANKEICSIKYIVNGGAIFDFISGRFQRAPKVYRNLHIEWVYRLMQEPKRLFKRYVFGNSMFVFRMVLNRNDR